MFPLLPEYAKICSNCRKNGPKNSNSSSSSDDATLQSSSFRTDEDDSIMNDWISSLVSRMTESYARSEREVKLGSMLKSLKYKLTSLEINNPLRSRILTVAPDTWSIHKIFEEFDCSWNFAKKSKDLKSSGRVLDETTNKEGHSLPSEETQKIIDFYNSMPGMKDALSVKTAHGRTQIQKRLLLLYLGDLYSTYNEEHKVSPVSFRKFAQLGPKNCILPVASGTHAVRVCIIYENCKLMIDAINLTKLTANSEHLLVNHKDCFEKLTF